MGGGGGVGEGGGNGEEGFVLAEAEFASAKTSVWWDIENCQVLKGCDPNTIARNISSALANVGYKGMVSSISAYGDTSKIPPSVQNALNSTGVSLNHVPAGVKDASDKKILVEMLFWAVDNPAPANYLLISGDRDFSNALHQLRMRRYNILLAHAPNVSPALVAAAKCVWQWSNLIVGDPPLNSETSQSNATGSNSGSTEKSKAVAYEPRQFANPTTDSSQLTQKPYGNGRPDNRQKVKPTRKSINNSKHFSSGLQDHVNGNSEKYKSNHLMQQVYQVSSVAPTLEVRGNAQVDSNVGKLVPVQSTLLPCEPVTEAQLLKEAPHKFYGNSKPSTYSGPMTNLSSPIPDVPLNNGNNHPNNQVRSPQLLKPSDLLTTRPSFAPGNLYPANSHNFRFVPQPPGPYRPPFASSTSPLDINRLNLSDCPVGVQQKNPSQSQNVETWPNNTVGVQQKNPSQSQNVETRPNNNGFVPQPPRPYRPPFAYPTRSPDINHCVSHCPVGIQQKNPSYPQNVENRPNFMDHSGVPPNIYPAPDFVPYNSGRPDYRPPAVDGNAQNNGAWGMPGCPQPSTDIQFHIGNILHALHILKTEKVTPTEANIADCIHYGEISLGNFNVRLGLDYAIGHHMVVKQCLGTSLPLYIGKNDRLWKCVNIMDANAKHPKATWNTVKKFISSPEGCSAILETQNRYQAAIVLKNCLKNLALGDVLQILHLAISVKKWITPHFTGWKPISINLPVPSDKCVSLIENLGLIENLD